ncbi:hypothetical protein [Falsiruegeria litorea]|uniref:Uncharacterized protein n=1 Tax=Falsiruegeria litorea TaxID=1280831 RepID=A0ABS5WW40_9RHOB|nr:hypothetical protein [Falsiruegeria litorea]MBT3142921.1 hypothetical protein [Falsiruegeria litorea]MBT8169615.1 hypothetical protein [Falsiruegeria litorea]
MRLSFSPVRRDDQYELVKIGDTLTINGEAFDFSPIPEGATLPRAAVDCDWLASDVVRIDGVLHLTLMLPHGPRAPQETLFPTSMEPVDGKITLPSFNAPVVPKEAKE